MKQSITFSFLIFALAGIASCSSNIAISTPESNYSWWTQWLDEPICKPPCWANITPGVTSMDEALSILGKMPEVKITYKDQQGVDWRFNQTITDSGTLRASQNGIISVVVLGNSNDKKLLLETVAGSYGNPAYVKPYDCRIGMCSTVLVYPDSGMLLNVFLEDAGDKSNHRLRIESDTAVEYVIFFPPGLENFERMAEYQEYDLLMEWHGYGEYP